MGTGRSRTRLLCVAAWALACLLPSALPAQAPDPAATQNEQKARATLDAMITALGGPRWLSLTDTMYQGRTSGFYQGKPTGAITEFWQLHEFPDKDRIELGKKRDVVNIVTGGDAWELTYRGKREMPKEQSSDFIRRRDHSVEAATRLWLNAPGTILIYGGQNVVERHLADEVTLIDSHNDSIVIQMDAETHLPLRRSFEWRDPLYKDKNTESEEYDDYHVIDGIPTPFTVTRYHNGDMVNQRFLFHAAYNQAVPPGTFDADQSAAKIKR